MAKAISARRQGDDYQARFFWINLVQLRTNDFYETVTFESDLVPFVDDLVVTYAPSIRDKVTGRMVSKDLFQCKYHVTQSGSFSSSKLVDPKFISSDKSMLQRLYEAYGKLQEDCAGRFRLYVVSAWGWHPDDPLAKHLYEETIRDSVHVGGTSSKTGKVLQSFASHLGVELRELRPFLSTLRFKLSRNLSDLSNNLNCHLDFAKLKRPDPTETKNLYDDLAWKLFEQGRNTFDKATLEKLIIEESLLVNVTADHTELSVSSFPQVSRRPGLTPDSILDLESLFYGRFPKDSSAWRNEIPSRIVSFLDPERLQSFPQPIDLWFDCHLSIAFLSGWCINPKAGINVVPVHKMRMSGFEKWPEYSGRQSGLWVIERTKGEATAVVVAISVSNNVRGDLHPYLRDNGLNQFERLECQPAGGIGQNAIENGDHAWQLGFDLAADLSNQIPESCQMLHLFYSGPAALSFILGNALRSVRCCIQLYEYDFERKGGASRYRPSIVCD